MNERKYTKTELLHFAFFFQGNSTVKNAKDFAEYAVKLFPEWEEVIGNLTDSETREMNASVKLAFQEYDTSNFLEFASLLEKAMGISDTLEE